MWNSIRKCFCKTKTQTDIENLKSLDSSTYKQKLRLAFKRALIHKKYSLAHRILDDEKFDITTSKGRTPLLLCVLSCQLEQEALGLVEKILNNPKSDVNANDPQMFSKSTALHSYIMFQMPGQKNLQLLNLFTGHPRCDLTVLDDFGQTPLRLLLQESPLTSEELCSVLKHMKTNPTFGQCISMCDQHGYSVLDWYLMDTEMRAHGYASCKGRRDVLNMLLQCDKLTNLSGKTLSLAITYCDQETCQLILDKTYDVNKGLPGNETPLHCAVEHNSIQKVNMIMTKKPDLNIKWKSRTPLELAIVNKAKVDILELLSRKMKINELTSYIQRNLFGYETLEECVERLNVPY